MPERRDWHDSWFGIAENFFVAECASHSATKALRIDRPPRWMLVKLFKVHEQAPSWVPRNTIFDLGRMWAAHQIPCERPTWPPSIATIAAQLGMPESTCEQLCSSNREIVKGTALRVLQNAAVQNTPVCLARLGNELNSLRFTRTQKGRESPSARVRDRWRRHWVLEQQSESER